MLTVSLSQGAYAQGLLCSNGALEPGFATGLVTGATSQSGVAAPAGERWSEVANPAGDTTQANATAGFGCQKIGATMLNRCADDFRVPPGPGWSITGLVNFAYQTGFAGTTSAVVLVNVALWGPCPDSTKPGDAGCSVIAGDETTNRLSASVSSSTRRTANSIAPAPGTTPSTTRLIWRNELTFSPAVVLGPGRYWFDFQVDAGTLGNFVPSLTLAGVRGLPTFNGVQKVGAAGLFNEARDFGGTAIFKQDFPFEIYGTGKPQVECSNSAPKIGTVTPSALTSAPGIAQKLSAVYSDADGYANIRHVHLRINPTSTGAKGIRLSYDRKVNKLFLYNDAGTGYVGNCAPGAAKRLSNTQGTLNCRTTTVTGSGNDLTVTWSITPKAAFVSTTKNNLYLFARDFSNAEVGWKKKGNWTIKATNVAPSLGAVTPAVRTSGPAVAKTFSAVYSDADGYSNLKYAYLLVNTTLVGSHGIKLRHDRTVNKLYLYNDAGTGSVGNCTPGVAGSLSNSQGTLNCKATTVTGSGNNLTIKWNITPQAAFATTRKKNLYLFASDMSNVVVGWAEKGNWTINNPDQLGDANGLDSDEDEQVIGTGIDFGVDEDEADPQ